MTVVLSQNSFPVTVVSGVLAVAAELQVGAWVAGGTVRDWVLLRSPKDLDLTISGSAEQFCRCLLRKFGEGALVPLGTADEEACRVVWRDWVIDVSSFRGSARSIEDDLVLRDFTINAMALPLQVLVDGQGELIDPLGGLRDLGRGILTHCDLSFESDPLRILRGFRFSACYGFEIADATLIAMTNCVPRLAGIAAERISVELDLIISSTDGAKIFRSMQRLGILELLIPELSAGQGVEQPIFHHLDVFEHSLAALEHMTKLVGGKNNCYLGAVDDKGATFDATLVKRLCWAALLHDVGKPATRAIRPDKGNRVTFYGHDEVGGRLVRQIAKRLRWSKETRESVAHLVTMHMHPFHLCTVQDKEMISRRAALKMYHRAGELLLPLFMLAMSDSLASEGEDKPPGMEESLVRLYRRIDDVCEEFIYPVLRGKKLLTGKDLMDVFQLQPGPFIGELLGKLEEAQVEGEIVSRDEALGWAKKYIENTL